MRRDYDTKLAFAPWTVKLYKLHELLTMMEDVEVVFVVRQQELTSLLN
jgi:hypothetical protein